MVERVPIIILPHKLDFNELCRVPFGSYCEAHDEPPPTNNMVSWSTPAIVLGPTGNLQGTSKFFSLETRAKIKRRLIMRYPMPDLIIKKVERFARGGIAPGALDFANRSGILFEWNEAIDKSPKSLVEKDVVLYPSIVFTFPGVTPGGDVAVPTVKDEVELHGRPKDEVALNVGLEPLNIAGVDQAAIIDAHADKVTPNYDYDDDGIIAVGDLPKAGMGMYNQDVIVMDNENEHNDHRCGRPTRGRYGYVQPGRNSHGQ
jgi:hypothetical protein